jgi:hypothetical protein
LLVQGGLYVHALRSAGYQPAGMVYAGFRREASFGGWVIKNAFVGLSDPCDIEVLNDVVRQSTEVAMSVVGQIRDGRITPAPADQTKCEYCSYSVACRVETIAVEKARQGAGG